MTASLPGVFSTQQFTDAGLLAAGYRLYTYSHGTTTQKTAYTDSAGSVAHTYTSDGIGGQYIALGSRGELPAGLFLTAGSYDLCLKTPAGSTVWTRHATPIADATDALTSAASDAVGSALVGYLPAGAGAVATTVQAKLRQHLSVADFGFSTAANATDNTAAFAAAWAYSKQLFIPAGTYNVTSLPNFAVRGTRIKGIGRVVLNISGAGPGLVVDAGATGSVVQDIVIDDLTINCTGSATIGIYIRAITHSQFDRLRPINFPSYAMNCEFMVSNIFNDFCHSGNEPGITTPSVIGVGLGKRAAGEQCSNCTWINPVIEGTSGTGLVLDECAASTFVCGTVEGCASTTGSGGILIGPNSIANTFINTDLESNGIAGDATTYHIKNSGIRTSFINIFCDAGISGTTGLPAYSPLVWIYGNNTASFYGGQIENLKIEAGVKNTVTNGLAYSGTITDAGTNTRHIQLYAITSATTLPDSYVTKGTWTPVAASLTIVGTPTYVGTYERVGDLVTFTIRVTSTTSTAATAGTTSFTAPTSTVVGGTCVAASNVTAIGFGTGAVSNNFIYPPSWAASANVVITGQYFAS